MSIVVEKPIVRNPEPEFRIRHDDAELVKRVKYGLGNVDACRVVRLMVPGCSLKTAIEFVREL